MIALCAVVNVAKAKGAREPWLMKPASWTKVREDALETKTVTQSRQLLRKITLKSRCSRTVKDETSCRVCQTRGQLGTNARNGVANTVRARLETTMNHTPMSEETKVAGALA
uniref:Uncharacterized protein n=1 Tax=Oryza glumipatula TaxID=40148 RepID=A0A0D9ZHS5_9ORYZ